MKFTQLSTQEFQDFMNSHLSHYTQSISLFNAHNNAHLVGVKDEHNQVLAACLLTETRALKFFKYFYTQRGPVMDYRNTQLVHFFFKSLTRYLKQHKGLYVRVDPYEIIHIRNADGEIIESRPHQHWMHALEQLGYRHQGFSTGYSNISQIRWLSVLDLEDKSEDQLLKEMDYQTRRNIKKTFEMGVEIKTLTLDETERFYRLNKMAEEKHNFKFRDLAYFKRLQKVYGDQITLKLAYIDLEAYAKSLQKKLETLELQLDEVNQTLKENPNSKKNKSKAKQLQQQHSSQSRKTDEAHKLYREHGKILDLAAAVFIFNRWEVYYLSSGSNPEFNRFMGAYRLQWEMIKFAKDRQIPRYNFYGITGDFSDQAEDAGVQQFKKGFNAHVEEYPGDFIKPLRPFVYKVAQLLKRLMKLTFQ
ncbi:aminoacyltransferase [Staphylococcus canis]|uniref:Aminoacyltransferase FemA n=1 Tax=Staphylococcus canis TaxID=2724942 RepID=A0ABS0T823_9STAP|nr:aminoacyltransferase [Staphylococcus canis]MBI5974720.1 aminoacyltransferase [Staphylococcus canis]